MKRVCFGVLALWVLFLAAGCARAAAPSFSLDEQGRYTGFNSLPTDYTVRQAVRDGCHVVVDGQAEDTAVWDRFIARASAGEEASVRIVSFSDGAVYFQDVFYTGGGYHAFDSSAEDQSDRVFAHLLTLTGSMPNAVRSSSVTILTDDEDLTYNDVVGALLSSSSQAMERISPFRMILWG
jgi:hypothetical protein